MRSRFPRILLALSLPLLCWTLAGCGGGDGGSNSTADNSGNTSTDTPEAMPGGHDEEPTAEEPTPEADDAGADEAADDAGADEAADDAGADEAADDAGADDAALVEDPAAVEDPGGAFPGGELVPNGAGAAKSDLPDVPEDSAEWPAVELIRRVRAGETDSIPELLYPSQRRGLVGRLASDSSREEAVTELQGLFSEIIPIDARQIDNEHKFTVLNSQASAQIEFTVRRTKDGFVVHSVNSREVDKNELRKMLRGRGAGGSGQGNPGGY